MGGFVVNPDKTETQVRESQAQGHDEDHGKLVPVTESIRYRRRAQSAEKEVEALSQELEEAKAEVSKMAKNMKSMELEHKLTQKLTALGTVDLETAMLLAKTRLKNGEDSEIESVVEKLKQEKQHLFDSRQSFAASARKTAGVKDKVSNRQAKLAGAAKKAATSGNRADLQEYLRLRRDFV